MICRDSRPELKSLVFNPILCCQPVQDGLCMASQNGCCSILFLLRWSYSLQCAFVTDGLRQVSKTSTTDGSVDGARDWLSERLGFNVLRCALAKSSALLRKREMCQMSITRGDSRVVSEVVSMETRVGSRKRCRDRRS
jgi:hypothetical protein